MTTPEGSAPGAPSPPSEGAVSGTATEPPGRTGVVAGPSNGAPRVGTDPGPTPEAERTGLADRLRHPLRRRRERDDERVQRRVAAQLAEHWAQTRAERRHEEQVREAQVPNIHAGTSNFTRAQVPWGVDLAAAWSWRFLVIVAAGYVVARTIGFFSLVVMPVVIALFLAALVGPVVDALARLLPRGLATLAVVLSVLGVVGLMITFATQQVINGANDLSDQVVDALAQIQVWLRDGPLHASEDQINNAIQQAQDLVTSSNAELVRRLTEVGTTLSHIIAGFFIVLFATYFFLYDGRMIWAWVVRLFPRAARSRVDGSGRVAWTSLTQFVRATVIVALVDAIGIMVVAAVLKVPFVMAIGVLVFLGAFVPMVGATLSGIVAVLVALVAQGPLVALLMLAGVIGVQQLEAHVLQPFLLGRMVSVHPLAVILAVAGGVFLAGIAGALVAVPLAASLNAVVVYLSSSPSAEEGQERAEEVADAIGQPPSSDEEPSSA